MNGMRCSGDVDPAPRSRSVRIDVRRDVGDLLVAVDQERDDRNDQEQQRDRRATASCSGCRLRIQRYTGRRYIATTTPRIVAMMTVRTIHRNSTRTIDEQRRRDQHAPEFRQRQLGEILIRAPLECAGGLRRVGRTISVMQCSAQRLFDVGDEVYGRLRCRC